MMRKPLLHHISFIFLLSLPQLVIAAEDNTDIQLQLVNPEFVSFTGTVVDTAHYFTEDEVKPEGTRRRGPRVTLGTLGLSSNVSGDCTLDFSTKNNFRLRHTVTNRRLSNFRLRYRGKNITRKKNRQLIFPCNYNPRKIHFNTTGRFLSNVQPGVYSDTVRIEVATQ